MKAITYSILCFFISCIIFTSCEDNNSDEKTEVNSIIATGSNDSIDKSIWGDFELVLELDKSKYKTQENINVQLFFSNIGDIDITFPAIIPANNLIMSPKINIWSNNIRINIDKLTESLDASSELRIEINEDLMLIDINLLNAEGIFWEESNNLEQEEGNIGEQLLPGTYFASASFSPELQTYGSFTDTLSFQIE